MRSFHLVTSSSLRPRALSGAVADVVSRWMISVARYFLPFLVATVVCSCRTEPTMLTFSKRDHTTQSLGDDTNYGSRKHYVHILRGPDGQPTEIYRYYFDETGKPVLDGIREIRRWEHDAGHIIEYRNGHVVREYDVIVTG